MDREKQIEYFEGLLEKHGENYLALDWNSPESQRIRFSVLSEIFIYGKKAANVSVLDVGCGFGDLYGYFRDTGLIKRNRINYTGFDISPKMIGAAKRKYTEARFELKDILEEKETAKFDYLFCSGVFNIRTTDLESHLDFVKSMLLRMFELSNFGLAVNLLSEGAIPIALPQDLNSGRYFYFSPEVILAYCRSICNRYILRHDYHLGDFTVYLLK
jgi:SAM-dependent methyltransferase